MAGSVKRYSFFILLIFLWASNLFAMPSDYTWYSPGQRSSESMPVGGGGIGMNVWMDGGDIVFFLCEGGSFDENNTLLKSGKFRLKLSPVIIGNDSVFRQTLHLSDGYLSITDGSITVNIWADVAKPVAHVEVSSSQPVTAELQYESWRSTPRLLDKREAQQCSYKWAIPKGTATTPDFIEKLQRRTYFYHRNPENTVFDITVHQQGLDSVAQQMYNPIAGLVSGGVLISEKRHDKQHHFLIALANKQSSVEEWRKELNATLKKVDNERDRVGTRRWWRAFWERSYIEAGGDMAEACRNYTLFRYMLGCSAGAMWPVKFNGGLFTFEPVEVDSIMRFTPDFRRWGGGTFTAQNQRLVYWPMLMAGDYDLMKPQFDFYRRILPNAMLRTKCYWNHGGACFPEQIENFGLPNYAEYGTKRPSTFDRGVEYNAWLEYEWDTVLEFCQMILMSKQYGGLNIDAYIPLIRESLTFFDEHYRYLASRRGKNDLDAEGRLIIYPGSGCETYKQAYNPSSTVSALRTVLETFISEVDSSAQWCAMLERIPKIPIRHYDGYDMISPAETWARVQNVETPQLYPVFPWRRYGIGREGLDIARNTYYHDPDALRFRSSKGWKQDNIWAACLGLTDEAMRLTKEKMASGPYRFPAFWGPGYDWSPDHNWGGSGMLGLQFMLLQEVGDKIYLFPAWDKRNDVSFRLHLSRQTTVEAVLKGGKVTKLKVTPASRQADIVLPQVGH